MRTARYLLGITIGWLAGASTLALPAGVATGDLSSCQIDPVLRSLESKTPIKEAEASIARGDFALLEVCAFACAAPGISGEPDCWIRELGVVTIRDTTDGTRCEEHRRLQEVARAF